MAAEDKKISVLTEWFNYEDIVDIANIVVAYAGLNYKIAMSTIRQYVLGNREINGTGSGDIPTNGGTQIFTNKTLYQPAFNDATTLNSAVTSTQMNFLENLDTNVKAKFTEIDSNVNGVENTVENLSTTINALQADKIYSVGIGVGAGASSITINASSISNYDVDPYSLSISVYEQTSPLTMKLLNLSDIDISISDNILSSIGIAEVFPEKAYQIVIRYRLAE